MHQKSVRVINRIFTMGKWENGEMGEWGNERMGKWGNERMDISLFE
jgi:hypothetical protein